MSTEADHICGDLPCDRHKSILYNNRKEYQNHSSIRKVLFTCGACLTKFRTVCRLHYHLEHHQEGGSYTYDHVTKTAFPKHDSICAYTQVEQNFVIFVAQTTDKHDKRTSSVEECDLDIMNNDEGRESHSEGTRTCRKSKRIALRQNKMETKPKASGIELDKTEKPGVKNSGHQKISASESESLKTKTPKEVKGLKGKKVNKTKYGTRKRRKLDTEEIPQSLQVDNAEDGNAVQDSKNLSDNENMNISVNSKAGDKSAKIIPEKFNTVEQNTDEITASEALIAISKSVNGENLKNMTNNEADVRKTDVTKHQSRLSDKTNHSSSDYSNNHRIQPNGLMENSKESSEIPDYLSSVEDDKNLETLKLPEGQIGLAERTSKRECPVCGKCGTRAMLSYHKYLHKEQKELSCDKCGKQFQHPSCLKVSSRVKSYAVHLAESAFLTTYVCCCMLVVCGCSYVVWHFRFVVCRTVVHFTCMLVVCSCSFGLYM